VTVHGVGADHEPLGDLSIAEAMRDVGEYLELTGGQLAESARRCAGRAVEQAQGRDRVTRRPERGEALRSRLGLDRRGIRPV
jgi:hypothetical protein